MGVFRYLHQKLQDVISIHCPATRPEAGQCFKRMSNQIQVRILIKEPSNLVMQMKWCFIFFFFFWKRKLCDTFTALEKKKKSACRYIHIHDLNALSANWNRLKICLGNVCLEIKKNNSSRTVQFTLCSYTIWILQGNVLKYISLISFSNRYD